MTGRKTTKRQMLARGVALAVAVVMAVSVILMAVIR